MFRRARAHSDAKPGGRQASRSRYLWRAGGKDRGVEYAWSPRLPESPRSVGERRCGAPLLLVGEGGDQFAAEVRDVGDDAAPDQVPVSEGRLVHPRSPGVL